MDMDFQITVARNPGTWTTGNGLLFTSFFYTILYLNNLIDREDRNRFSDCVDLCWEGSTNNPIQGLLERNDGREDLEAHDNYHIVTASFLLKTYHSESIYNYGHNYWWSYNNINPGRFTLRTWHYRHLGHVGYLCLAANKQPDWLQGTALKWKIEDCDLSRSDRVMMDFLKCNVMLYNNNYKSSALKWINKATEEQQTLGKLLEPYFGTTHPFSKIPSMTGVF